MENVGVYLGIGQSNNDFFNGPEHYTLQFRRRLQYVNTNDCSLHYAEEPFADSDGSMSWWGTRFGDTLLDRGIHERVVLANIARAGVTASSFAPGGANHYLLYRAATAIKKNRLTLTAVLWQQGEHDASPPVSTPYATYMAQVRSVKATLVALGVPAPFYVCVSTFVNGMQSNSPAIRAAQTDLVNKVDFFALVNTDQMGFEYRYDGVHFNTAGARRLAAEAAAAIYP